MKNYFFSLAGYLKEVLFDDIKNRYLFITTLILSLGSFFFWERFLAGGDIQIYTRITLYPVKYLALVLILNTLLSIFSYNKEREISYLLFVANIVLVLLTWALEIFYFIYSR